MNSSEVDTSLLPPIVVITQADIDKVKKDFLDTGDDFDKLSERHDFGPNQIELWHAKGGWRDLRKKQVEDKYQSALDEFRMFVSVHRVPVLEQHLKTTNTLQNKVGECIDGIDVDDRHASHTLERMSRALKNVVDTSAKILAVSEQSLGGANGSNERQPFIYVGVHPSADAKTINVEAVEREGS